MELSYATVPDSFPIESESIPQLSIAGSMYMYHFDRAVGQNNLIYDLMIHNNSNDVVFTQTSSVMIYVGQMQKKWDDKNKLFITTHRKLFLSVNES